MGQGPGLLDLDLEQLLKSGQAPACVPLWAQKQPLEKPGENHLLLPTASRAHGLTQALLSALFAETHILFPWTVRSGAHRASPLRPPGLLCYAG